MDPKNLEVYFTYKLQAEIGPQDLKKLLSSSSGKSVIIDVRQEKDFREQHIPGAQNIPLEEIEAWLTELSKDSLYICYSWSVVCGLAPRAALLLAKNGFQVKELVGGIHEWKRAGFDISEGMEAPAAVPPPQKTRKGEEGKPIPMLPTSAEGKKEEKGTSSKGASSWPPRPAGKKPPPPSAPKGPAAATDSSKEKKEKNPEELKKKIGKAWDVNWRL